MKEHGLPSRSKTGRELVGRLSESVARCSGDRTLVTTVKSDEPPEAHRIEEKDRRV
jgi:hypothetical protein